MNKKTVAIIVTIVALLFCGCPGLGTLLWGAISAIVSFIPNADIDMMGSSDPQTALYAGIGGVCGGLIFILIAAVAIFLVWRRKDDAAALPPQ